MENFIKLFEQSVNGCWNEMALADFRKSSCTYGELAGDIAALHQLWSRAGLQKGDRIALNARSCSNWVKIFMASVCGGYCSVELFNGFTASATSQLVCHSGSRLLYTEKNIFDGMNFDDMPEVIAAIDVVTGELLAARGDFKALYEEFKNSRPQLKEGSVHYEERPMEEVCAIMYTSGSTGSPKGVMLTVKNFSANVYIIPEMMPFRKGENYLSLLPYAHIFGLTVDAIIPLCKGLHLTILCLPPIPRFLKEALAETRPHVFFGVPLIFIKFIEDSIGSLMDKEKINAENPDEEYLKMLADKLTADMGGNVEVFATGGAAIPHDLENLLAFKLKVPFVTGYGMTECAPIISVGVKGKYKARSCGVYVDNLELRIASDDPATIPGEVQVRGDEVFKGYYHNDEATAAAFTEDGWFRTGDMGTVDSEKNLFLVGRCKNMLLSANGQNVYPEEIEVYLNAMPYVTESLIVQRGNALVALIVVNPDAVAAAGLDADSLDGIMHGNIAKLNKLIPAYSAVAGFELRYEPFVKTPKGSIRRFMYK